MYVKSCKTCVDQGALVVKAFPVTGEQKVHHSQKKTNVSNKTYSMSYQSVNC